MPHNLPTNIEEALMSGNAILFLGAGASFGALLDGKPTSIDSEDLKKKLSDKFLKGQHKDKSLMFVADLSRNESTLKDLQGFVRETFFSLEPASFHLKIPTYRWKAIVTTNYDLLIEKSYDAVASKLQILVPITKDGKDLETANKIQNSLPYLKLHGCISNHKDTDVPIVLDSFAYSKFSNGRKNLVTTFKEWAQQHPIIFCGYSLSDENIKEILFDIGDLSENRCNYLYVSESFSEAEVRFWTHRRIQPFASTFQGFIECIDKKIPQTKRLLSTYFSSEKLTISKYIPSHKKPSNELLMYLNEELLHIEKSQPNSLGLDPKKFYSGLDNSFLPLYNNLDIQRKKLNNFIEEAILNTFQSIKPKSFIIKGYAGSGKSVFAKRVAIETSCLLDEPLVIWMKEGSIIRTELILELQELVNSRLYFFIDDAIDSQTELVELIKITEKKEIPITIIFCARTNELAIYGDKLKELKYGEFELFDLDSSEVDELLKKLTSFKLLGPLEKFSDDEKQIVIGKFYGQQLLVALHEITFGDTFENILISEFEKILPRDAQQLYLNICTLHQFGLGMRAGLLSRISGIPIIQLNEFLNKSLSRVVRSIFQVKSRDYVYQSRHQEISKMIFSIAITSQQERASQLIKILTKMDLDYSSDHTAFFQLLKGKRLAELFENKELAISVFDAAENANPPLSFIYHQKAILELNHPNGSDEAASRHLKAAEDYALKDSFTDKSIQHTKANLLRKKALNAKSNIEKDKYRSEARSILKQQMNKVTDTYPDHLYGLILLDEIRDFFGSTQKNEITNLSTLTDDTSIRIIAELSEIIDKSLKINPDQEAIIALRSEFFKVIGKTPQAIDFLKNYYQKKNSSSSTISRLYAEALFESGDLDSAITVIRSVILSSPNDKLANLLFAKMLIFKDEEANKDTIMSCLRRSFSDDDTHFEARLLFARHNLLHGDVDEGKKEFIKLQQNYFIKDKLQLYPVKHNGLNVRFNGKIMSKQMGFGFISSSELKFNTYFKMNNNYESLKVAEKVVFSLAFNHMGPTAFDLKKREE